MKRTFVIAAAGGLIALAGCHSDGTQSSTPARTQYQYSSMGSSDIVVVPLVSKVADLAKPEVSVKSTMVTITGVVRLRSGPYNPDAVLRIVVVDRHGQEGEEIRALLKETDTPGVLSYKANFAPVPPKGSSVAISYEDWHPMEDYASSNIGSGGGANGSPAAVSGPSVSTGQGVKSGGGGSKSGGKPSGLSGPKFGK